MLTRFLNAVIFLALRSQNCLPVESMTAHMVVRQSELRFGEAKQGEMIPGFLFHRTIRH